MEIRLLLVDDEDLTREGLLHYVEWGNLGITHIKAASNGIQALKIASEFEPDILLTDIRMPHMSGIELAHEIRKRSPSCRILFISGYAEKEYLKSAITLKVDAYIDKPATPGNVSLAVAKTAEAINREREKSRLDMLRTRNLGRAEDIVKDRVALILIQKQTDWIKFHEDFVPSYFTWPESGTCYAVCLHIDFPNFPSYPYADCFNIREYWKREGIFSDSEYFSGVMEHLCIFFLVMTKSPGRIRDAAQQLQQWIKQENERESTVVAGPPVTSFKNLAASYHSAVCEMACICFYEDRPRLTLLSFNFVHKPAPASLFSEKQLSPERYAALLDSIASERFTDINYISQKLYELYLFIMQKNPGAPVYSLDDFRSQSLPRLRQDIDRQISESLLPSGHEDYEPKIRQAINYIYQYYGDEKLSIKMIADQVELSQNYFCTLFKKNCGMTVNDFIVKVRIDKARYLLKNTNLKLYEISRQIGIPDANYLNILFKKICHMTPSQYRREA